MKIAQRLIAGSATFSVLASASQLCTNCDNDVVDESLPMNAHAMDFLEEDADPAVSVMITISPDASEGDSFLQRHHRSEPSKSPQSASFAQMSHGHHKKGKRRDQNPRDVAGDSFVQQNPFDGLLKKFEQNAPPAGPSMVQLGHHHNRGAASKSEATAQPSSFVEVGHHRHGTNRGTRQRGQNPRDVAGNSFVQLTENPFAGVLSKLEQNVPPAGASMVQLGHHHNRGAESKVASKREAGNGFVQTEAEFDVANLINDIKAQSPGASMVQVESPSYFDKWLKHHPPREGSVTLRGSKAPKGRGGAKH